MLQILSNFEKIIDCMELSGIIENIAQMNDFQCVIGFHRFRF